MSDSSVLQPHSCKQYNDSVADREDGEEEEGRGQRDTYYMCEAIMIKRTHAHTLIDRFKLTYPKKKKLKYFWIYETIKKNYCIHVLLQRCKIWHVWVGKKNHKKNKICKEFDVWTFNFVHCLLYLWRNETHENTVMCFQDTEQLLNIDFSETVL